MTANMKLLVMGRLRVREENKKTDGLDGPVDHDNEGPFQDGNLRGNGGVRGAVAPPRPPLIFIAIDDYHTVYVTRG